MAKAAIKAVGETKGEDAVESEVTREEISKAFATVDGHLQGLANAFNSNGQVIRQGFLSNDVWFETLRLVVLDVARTQKDLCDKLGVQSLVLTDEHGEAHLEEYWNKAHASVVSSMEEQEAEAPEEDAETAIYSDGPIVQEFGGDYVKAET